MKQFNVFKLENKKTKEVFYCKGIDSQVYDEESFINKLMSIAVHHPNPGKMYRSLQNTVKSEWGVEMKAKRVTKEAALEVKRMWIQEDKKCSSQMMTK